MIGSTKYTTILSPSPIKKKNKSLKIFSCFIIIVLVIVVIAFFTGGKEQKVNENNKKEINELFNLLKEDDDKDNIFKYLKISENRLDTNIENNHQYIAKAIVGAKIGNYIENTEAVTIEVFNNTDDLKLRVEYLKAQNDYLDEIYENEKYGNLPNMADLPNKRIIYTRKNILMSVDNSISSDLVLTYSNILYKAVDKMNFEQNDFHASKDLDELEEYYDGELNVWKQKYPKDSLLNGISLLVNNMNKQVDLAYASNNNNLVTNCLDELKYYDVTKYQQEYLHWKKLLTTAKENLDNGLISPDMMEKNNAYKQMVYTEGEYIIGVDILPGEYVVVKNDGIEKGRVFLEHQEDVSSNTIINASGDDFIGKKIVLNGTTMYHIDNSEQIKSKITNTFKVGKHIEAGEYEVTYDYYVNVYVLDEINGVIDVSTAEKYEVGPESKTITIKDGQYIVWNYNSLRISKK